MKRRRSGVILRWGGVLLAASIMVAWMANLYWCVSASDGDTMISLHQGSVKVWKAGSAQSYTAGLVVEREDLLGPELVPQMRRFRPGGWVAIIPLWVPFLLVVAFTAILRRLDSRRFRSGHCQRCGYNLTGNVSGTCPECGTPTPGAPAVRPDADPG